MSDKPLQGKASNPMIALLTNALNQVNIALTQGFTKVAARHLLNVHDDIRPDHQNDELRQRINNMAYPKINTPKKEKADLERVSLVRRDLVAILWKHGYWTDAAYGFHNPSKGRKST